MIVKVHLSQCINATSDQTFRIRVPWGNEENILPEGQAASAYLIPSFPELLGAPPGGFQRIIETKHLDADQVKGLLARALQGQLARFVCVDNAKKVNRSDPTGFYFGLIWSGLEHAVNGIAVHLAYVAFSSATGFDAAQVAFLGYANVFDPRGDGNPLFEDRLEVKIGMTVFPDKVDFRVWSENESEAQIIAVIRKIEADIATMQGFAAKVLEFIE